MFSGSQYWSLSITIYHASNFHNRRVIESTIWLSYFVLSTLYCIWRWSEVWNNARDSMQSYDGLLTYRKWNEMKPHKKLCNSEIDGTSAEEKHIITKRNKPAQVQGRARVKVTEMVCANMTKWTHFHHHYFQQTGFRVHRKMMINNDCPQLITYWDHL